MLLISVLNVLHCLATFLRWIYI